MKKVLFCSIILGTLFLYPSLHAVLSPLNQSVKEVQEILASRQLQSFQQSEPLEQILHVEKGYLVRTKTEEFFVEVEYDSSPYIGPRKYRLIFNGPTPRTKN